MFSYTFLVTVAPDLMTTAERSDVENLPQNLPQVRDMWGHCRTNTASIQWKAPDMHLVTRNAEVSLLGLKALVAAFQVQL